MNLVAKEYVASQRDRDGILVLSEFAGAAQELGEALRINPYDEEGTAATITRALEMPPERRRERMNAMFEPHPARRRGRLERPVPRQPAHRDGRVALEPRHRPSRARPSAHLDRVRGGAGAAHPARLRRHARADRPAARRRGPGRRRRGPPPSARRAGRPRPSALVSGRTRGDLERWFGGIEGLWLAVEHGALVRPPGLGWQPLRSGADTDWKDRVRPLLEQFSRSAPGSFVEEKELSLGWHYRLADPEFGAWLANELVSTLDQLLAGTELSVLRGTKVVEVHYAWANKGEVAATLRSRSTRKRFILAMGDDRTDEDMFARLPKTAWTIRVGRGTTRARFSVRDHGRRARAARAARRWTRARDRPET